MFGKSKKFRPINEYPESWTNAQGENQGNPMFVRVNSALKDAVGHPEYPFQIGVAVPLLDANTDGLPKETEFAALNAIEDAISDELVGAVLVAIITTSGMREFVLYAREWKPEEYESKVKLIEAKLGSHQLQFMMQQDPKWSTFKSLLD